MKEMKGGKGDLWKKKKTEKKKEKKRKESEGDEGLEGGSVKGLWCSNRRGRKEGRHRRRFETRTW